MNKKILIFLGLSIFILNLNSQVEARRRGGIIISGGVSEVQPGTWTYRKLVTISSSMIPATAGTLTNFSVLISWGTDTAIASHAQANGNDIKFMSYDTNSQLFHEREYYGGTSTGKGVFWVNIPELTPATYTMWMYYGNPTANYQGTKSTWNSNYTGVWHLNEISGTTIYDSTVNANNGTFIDVTLNATGIIGGATSFNGITSYINVPYNAIFYSSNWTFSLWIKRLVVSGSYERLISYSSNLSYDKWFQIQLDNVMQSGFVSTGGTGYSAITSETIPVNIWKYVVTTFDGTYIRIYFDGVLKAISSNLSAYTPRNSNLSVQFGRLLTEHNYNGLIDEIQISNTARNVDWIITSYNNQSNPGAYITIGDEETL